ncbi:caprin-2-like isoform X1 [Megalobrama amblycephala]|uniref:caprin-2-like isoform X1 n=1 Tax=Megalobrama amblycephala TaxID=75352 RepID=UPI002013D15C|nr:caprin-2-like isoform X1 [Megalobrama amblycephala]XP_048045823.1 caprin-2-like isoform X1 [Megalobrama amblycephala]
MKLLMSVVVLMCVVAAEDLMSPTIDLISEIEKFKTMEEKLNALYDEFRELRSKNEVHTEEKNVMNSLSSAVLVLNDAVNKQDQKQTETERLLDSLKSSIQTDQQNKQRDFESLSSSLGALKSSVSDLTSSVASLSSKQQTSVNKQDQKQTETERLLDSLKSSIQTDQQNKQRDFESLSSSLGALKSSVSDLTSSVASLSSKQQTSERVNVAFSASLSASLGFTDFGPHTEATTLVYEHAFINNGNAYDTNTGIFTAPVKGVYFFIYVVFNPSNVPTGVRLLKNDKFVVAASDNLPGQDTEDTTCNSVTLLLEKGDRIHLQLIENRRVYADSWKRNTFSGHLLFTV